MRSMSRAVRVGIVCLLAVVVSPGCATTKSVLHTATFGLVGEESPSEKAASEAKQAEKQRREEEKARERQQEEARKAEERASKEAEEAQKKDQGEGWLSKATFGLLGGKEKSEEQAAAEAKQAEAKQAEKQRREEEKARERQQREARKAEERAREEAQKEEQGGGWLSKATFGLLGGKEKSEEHAAAEAKQAEAKQAEQQRREEEKARERQQREARKAEERAREEAQKEEQGGGWLSKATFGLLGGKEKSEEQAAAEAKQAEAKQAEKQRREEEKAREKQEKQARREAEKAQEAAEKPESKKKGKGWLAKATFGLLGGKREAAPETPPEEQPAKAQKPAPEDKPSVPKEEGEKQAAAEAPTTAPEASPAEPAPKKRTLMSKLTFGLIGGNGKPAPEAAPEAPLSPKAQKKTAKAETKRLARAEEETHRERVAAVPDAHRKLARLTFHTDIRQEEQFTGGVVGVADRESYTEDSYGICDIGTVRIAVRDMTFQGTWRTARIVVDSTRKESFTGSSGIGNRRFTYVYDNGVTKCTFGSVPFSISRNVLTIGGTDVPMDQGRRLVVVSADGKVEGAYPI